MEFLYEYGLFLAKVATFVIALLLAVGGIVGLASKQKHKKGELEITSLSDKLSDVKDMLHSFILDKDQLKKLEKEQKKAAKKDKKDKQKDTDSDKGNLYVIDFDGSVDAHEVDCLREEITAILTIATDKDEVLIRLESGGGVVHGYGLAASQLQRIKDKGIKLTIAVDKVAASGGYMMACVADKVLAARFAIIGSIGVIAQLPNFNKLLKKNYVDFEQHTAGEFKRTLTVFGENTEQGREKFRDELEEVHQMFKGFVQSNRPELAIDTVATGEYWYGSKALELGLVDEIQTSDDFLLKANEDKEIYSVKYTIRKNIAEKFSLAALKSVETRLMKWWQKSQLIGK
ncbi:protease SohB [Neptunicella sp. SCSIO 80796]|uniref:protease SohB n=1 Tax=Neptunicella plasticusilytica TaxID=3117012 RepID=UPI003A4DA798